MAAPKLVRNAEKVQACLKELPDGQLLTTQACKIQVPVRYSQRGLAQVGIETYVYGIYALILEDGTYAVSSVCAMVKILPFKVIDIQINGVPYHEFYFEANSPVIANINLVRRDVLIYNIFDEFMFKGNIPWFIEYEDLGKLFDTAKYHADSNVAQTYEVIELIASLVARNKEDRTKYYRTAISAYDELKSKPPAYVPLMSVFYSATNTLSKLAGSYYNDGVVSALVTPTHEVSKLEALLRA